MQFRIPWWDTISPAVYAELELPTIETLPLLSFDIVVIGAGVAGLSAALAARQAGASVLVLEADAMIGRGATGRNAGILSAGINMHLTDLDPGGLEAAFWPETTRVLLCACRESCSTGSIASRQPDRLTQSGRNKARRTYIRTRSIRSCRCWFTGRNMDSHPNSAISNGRLNTQGMINALWLPDEGRLNPLTLLADLAKQARTASVLLAGQARVDAFSEEHAIWRLALSNGMQIHARGLILAVGPTSHPNARIYALAFAADLPDNFPLFWDASPYTYADYRPGDGRLGVSGGRYGKAGVTRSDAKYLQRLADGARHWLPELQHQQPTYSWAVDLAVTAAMVPTLRPLSNIVPGFAIEGLGALGVLPGIVLGKRAGKQIVTQLA